MRRARAWAFLRNVRATAFALRGWLFVLLIVLASGTLLFRLSGHMNSLARALVYTLNLIAFQPQPSDIPDSPFLQLASFGLMMTGFVSVAAGLAKFVQYVMDEQLQQQALVAGLKDHVVVCGVGQVGYGVTKELLAFGETVVVVNRSGDEELLTRLRDLNVPIILGDARQSKTLELAGIKRAASVVCCTSDELTNLDIGLDARDLRPGIKVVLRMFDTTLAERVSRGFNIKTALSVSALAAPAFAAAATRVQIEHSFRIGSQLLNVRTVQCTKLAGQTLAALEQRFNLTVLEHNDALHPAGDVLLAPADRITCVGALDAIRALNAAVA